MCTSTTPTIQNNVSFASYGVVHHENMCVFESVSLLCHEALPMFRQKLEKIFNADFASTMDNEQNIGVEGLCCGLI